MDYGFENDQFYIEYTACSRPHGSMRYEQELYAKNLAESSTDLWLGLSGGVDSQSVLHSFRQIDYPLRSVFFYMPGYNDQEYENVKILENKYQIDVSIIDLDPMSYKDEIEKDAADNDIPALIPVLQKKFLEQLPDDCDFITTGIDPFVYVDPNSFSSYFYQGYYLPEICRTRAMASLNRKGKNILWGLSSEFLMSIIDDEIFRSAIASARYFDGLGIDIPGKNIKTHDRYDCYIKPLIYAKYWKDELIYFPKLHGAEKINYIGGNPKFKKHAVSIPYYDFLKFMNRNDESKRKFYSNVAE